MKVTFCYAQVNILSTPTIASKERECMKASAFINVVLVLYPCIFESLLEISTT
jgi:hypothetical protein